MRTYEQSTGRMLNADGSLFANCYSGYEEGKNCHAAQNQQGIGPLPCGFYTMGTPIPQTDTHGPQVIPLIPDASNQMFGRSGFLCHGDSIRAPGFASHGCIIADRPHRDLLAADAISPDIDKRRIHVVPGPA